MWLYCASSVAYSGRIACSISHACKTPRGRETESDNVTSCVPCSLAQSEAWCEKGTGYGSSTPNAFTITW